MISIEKNIPVPAHGADNRVRYPFHAMEVGDSFYVARQGEDTVDALVKRLRTSSGAAGRRLQRKFVVGIENDGVRVWRSI